MTPASTKEEFRPIPPLIRATFFRAFDCPVGLDEVSFPAPGPSELLEKVHASGACHTDLHAARDARSMKPALLIVLGRDCDAGQDATVDIAQPCRRPVGPGFSSPTSVRSDG